MARPKKNPDADEVAAQAVKPTRAPRKRTARAVVANRAAKTAKSTKTTKAAAKKTAVKAKTAKPKTATKSKATAAKPRKAKTSGEKLVKAATKKPAKTVTKAKKTATIAKTAKTTAKKAAAKKSRQPVRSKAAKSTEADVAISAPRKRGRPPKQKPEAAAEPEVPQKPGLVSMAPATKVRPSRNVRAAAKRDDTKVARVVQEQILAEELNQKVINSESGPSAKEQRAAARKAAALARKAAAEAAPVASSKKRQAVSVPPAAVNARRRRKLAFAGVWLVILAACLVGGYIYKTTRPVEAAQTAEAHLVAEVGKRVVLPADETPSISTVVNAKQVNQPFLEGAKNGDKVLLYFQAGRAVVYRPSTGQVVNMGTLQEPEPRVFIRKGSPDANVSKIASTIAASEGFTVDSQDVSPVDNYTKTIVVDVAGNRPDIAAKLAKLLNATVAPLPQGETLPDADLLVIVGSDAH